MRQKKQSPEIDRSSEAIASEGSRRPPCKFGRFLCKVKNVLPERNSRSKDSRKRDPVIPNASHEPPSTSNLEVQDTTSGVEQGADPQSAIQDAKKTAKRMNPLSGPVKFVASTGQNVSADLVEAAYNFQDTYLQPLRIFDSVIEKLADVHPYAKMALGVLSCASKIVLAQADRDKAVLSLLKKLGQVYGFLAEDRTLLQISSMRSIVGQISQQTLECAHFIRDYSETKNFWERLRMNVASETDKTIQKYSDVLDALMKNFRDQTLRDVAIFVHRTGDELNISGVAYAERAGLNTGKRCLPETRTEILSEIMGWINESGDDVPRVLWLSGPAGTGKSAIAHTIASSFIGVGGLGSCYCFDRNRDTDHLHEKIFSTIARDLADRHPEMRRALADAVQNATSLKTTADVFQQWQKLLMEPLGKLSEPTVGPVVIVIDALDESGKSVKTRRDILRILAGKIQDPAVPQITELPKNFRVIVTSRPLRDIEDELAGAQHIKRISMDKIPRDTTERDIYVYIAKMLAGLSDFGSKEFAALAEKAEGLFEWARLACEIIKSPLPGLSRNKCFDALVSRNPAKRETLLYDMYSFILTETMRQDGSTNAMFQDQQLVTFRSVMGQILGTAEPLPLNSLNAMRDHFPDESEHYEVEVIVKHLGSLLSGTTDSSIPIRPLHASFRDFLTDKSFSGEFFVDVSKSQRDLAFASLGVMEHGLSFNICDIKSSYLPNREVPGLRQEVERCIPPHLSYACRLWPAHVRTTDFDMKLAEEVKSFFDHERLLFWLEVLGLTKALSGAVAALPLIAKWLKGDGRYKDVSSTAMDVQRFIQVFGGMIVHSTPHLYISALPFSPINSAISIKFGARFPSTLCLAFGRDLNWTAAQTVLRGHTDSVRSVSFSPDGSRIVTSSFDNTVRLWDAVTGQPVGEPLRGHTHCVNSVSFSPDGTRIVTGSDDHTVRLWDAATGQPVGEPLRGHTDCVNSVSFSSDGTRIVTGSRDKTVRLWDAATGQPVGEPLQGHTHWVNSVSFSPDGTRIVTGSRDKTVRLWDAVTGQPVGKPLRGHTDCINSVSFSPSGTHIVTGSNDNTVQLWDAAMGQPVGEPLRGHTDCVNSVSFSPDGTRIVTGSSDNTVRLWDAATGQPVSEPLRGHTHRVNSVSFSPDGTRIVTGSHDDTVRLWDAVTGQPVGEPLWGNTHCVNSVSFSPDGTRIVTGSDDNTVRLWNAATGQPVGEPLRGHTGSVCSVSFSSDGTRIVTGSRDSTVRLWDAATGQPVGEPLRGHTDWVNSVSFSPDGTRVVTGSSDSTVRLWDATMGQPVGEPLRGHTDWVNSVSFSPNGTRFVTGSSDSTIRLWDAVTGQPVGEPLQGHTDCINSVSFSPDGTRIITGSSDSTVRLWDAATGQPVGEPLRGHTGSVYSASFSPDGTRIVTGSFDNTVWLWDAATGQPVSEPLQGHTDWVNSVSFSPDGTRIVTGSHDNTVRVWFAANGQVLQNHTEKQSSAASLHILPSTPPSKHSTLLSMHPSNTDFICFSSNTTHALHNAAELIEGTSPDDRRSTSFLLTDDGWMVGPNHRLLFWVPPASRVPFYTLSTAIIIPRGSVELDLSRMAHGRHWQNCKANPC